MGLLVFPRSSSSGCRLRSEKRENIFSYPQSRQGGGEGRAHHKIPPNARAYESRQGLGEGGKLGRLHAQGSEGAQLRRENGPLSIKGKGVPSWSTERSPAAGQVTPIMAGGGGKAPTGRLQGRGGMQGQGVPVPRKMGALRTESPQHRALDKRLLAFSRLLRLWRFDKGVLRVVRIREVVDTVQQRIIFEDRLHVLVVHPGFGGGAIRFRVTGGDLGSDVVDQTEDCGVEDYTVLLSYRIQVKPMLSPAMLDHSPHGWENLLIQQRLDLQLFVFLLDVLPPRRIWPQVLRLQSLFGSDLRSVFIVPIRSGSSLPASAAIAYAPTGGETVLHGRVKEEEMKLRKLSGCSQKRYAFAGQSGPLEVMIIHRLFTHTSVLSPICSGGAQDSAMAPDGGRASRQYSPDVDSDTDDHDAALRPSVSRSVAAEPDLAFLRTRSEQPQFTLRALQYLFRVADGVDLRHGDALGADRVRVLQRAADADVSARRADEAVGMGRGV
ncbi:hypothetical protein KC342_g119 [Hortaea werneckii]|nr:hypothetical protein KC342_g119 [Hortaea werneckii]